MDTLSPQRRKFHYIVLGFISAAILAATAYTFYTSRLMVVRYTPLIDAAMEIRLEATTAHLWFEEIISGDRYEDFDEILAHIDQAEWYAAAMLEGGGNPEGRFLPLREPALRKEIEKAMDRLESFRQITRIRYGALETSGIGSQIDQKYDALFKELIQQVDDVETLLQKKINRDFQRYRMVQILLISLIAVLCLAIFVLQFRHDQILKKGIGELAAAKSRAEESENWLKTTMNRIFWGLWWSSTKPRPRNRRKTKKRPWNSSSTSPRRWKPSARLRAASPMISTTSWP